MDAATLGVVLTFAAGAGGVLFTYVGKRGENAINGYSTLTGDLQEERDRLDRKVTDLQDKLITAHTELAAERSARAADQVEIARLRAHIIQPGGTLP